MHHTCIYEMIPVLLDTLQQFSSLRLLTCHLSVFQFGSRLMYALAWLIIGVSECGCHCGPSPCWSAQNGAACTEEHAPTDAHCVRASLLCIIFIPK